MEEKQNISERFKNAMSYKLSFIDWIVYTIIFALISIAVLFFTVMIMLMIWPIKQHNTDSINSNTTISSIDSETKSSNDNDPSYYYNKPIIDSKIPNEYDIYVEKDFNVSVYGGGRINIDPSMIILQFNGGTETLADALKLNNQSNTETSSNPTLGGKCNHEGDMSSSAVSSQGAYYVSQFMCSNGSWREVVPQ